MQPNCSNQKHLCYFVKNRKPIIWIANNQPRNNCYSGEAHQRVMY